MGCGPEEAPMRPPGCQEKANGLWRYNPPSDSVLPSRLHRSHPCAQSPPPNPEALGSGTEGFNSFKAFLLNLFQQVCIPPFHPSAGAWKIQRPIIEMFFISGFPVLYRALGNKQNA